uniref:Uncharacterized protein n=1 Tax=Moniliophthora roreri TaxID=221103 RepID=A0A0W0F3Z2_MONRR
MSALVNTAYLWSVHLSSSRELHACESQFLLRALKSVSRGFAPGCSRVLYVIQAEYLIAQYLFRNTKILEGKYHMTNAMSLVISARASYHSLLRVLNRNTATSGR